MQGQKGKKRLESAGQNDFEWPPLCFGHLQRKINLKLTVQKRLRALLNRFFTDWVSKKEATAPITVQRLLVFSLFYRMRALMAFAT